MAEAAAAAGRFLITGCLRRHFAQPLGAAYPFALVRDPGGCLPDRRFGAGDGIFARTNCRGADV